LFVYFAVLKHEKGLAFIEYATREKCVEIMGQNWKMNGRPAMVMQAGTKKPSTGTPGANSGLSQDERDMRTLFVKGLPFSSTPEDIVELFGCLQARLLKDHAGQSKVFALLTTFEQMNVLGNGFRRV
jgi:hypothetical protein